MAFTQKELQFTFSGAASGTLSVSGLRAVANIQANQGRLGTQAQVKIWGLSMAQMNAYSARIPTALGVDQFELLIEAGDLGDNLSQVVLAPIWESFIDLGDAPESAFEVNVAGIYLGANPIAAQSQPGAQSAEGLIASLCAAARLTFSNLGGAHAVLRNQATYGSVIDQIDQIADAAKFAWSLSGGTISVWPRGSTVDDVVIDVGPGTTPAMVGYPRYWEQGIIVTLLFNQQVQLGRQMNVMGSSLTKANGLWNIVNAQHSLSTMVDRGPWFTTAVLAAPDS
jgi:hypothetical protein